MQRLFRFFACVYELNLIKESITDSILEVQRIDASTLEKEELYNIIHDISYINEFVS